MKVELGDHGFKRVGPFVIAWDLNKADELSVVVTAMDNDGKLCILASDFCEHPDSARGEEGGGHEGPYSHGEAGEREPTTTDQACELCGAKIKWDATPGPHCLPFCSPPVEEPTP